MMDKKKSMEFFKRAMSEYTENNIESSVELLNSAIKNNPEFRLRDRGYGNGNTLDEPKY